MNCTSEPLVTYESNSINLKVFQLKTLLHFPECLSINDDETVGCEPMNEITKIAEEKINEGRFAEQFNCTETAFFTTPK